MAFGLDVDQFIDADGTLLSQHTSQWANTWSQFRNTTTDPDVDLIIQNNAVHVATGPALMVSDAVPLVPDVQVAISLVFTEGSPGVVGLLARAETAQDREDNTGDGYALMALYDGATVTLSVQRMGVDGHAVGGEQIVPPDYINFAPLQNYLGFFAIGDRLIPVWNNQLAQVPGGVDDLPRLDIGKAGIYLAGSAELDDYVANQGVDETDLPISILPEASGPPPVTPSSRIIVVPAGPSRIFIVPAAPSRLLVF